MMILAQVAAPRLFQVCTINKGPVRLRVAGPGAAEARCVYLVKPQNTSRIMLSNLSVRVSPTR